MVGEGGGRDDGRPRLVALRALGLGDLLTGVPALRGLADAFPGHRRILLAPSVLEPLVELTGTGFEVVHARGLGRLDSHRLGQPDVAVDLHGRGPGSQPLLQELEPRRLVAFSHPEVPGTEGHPAWLPDEHEVRRWCRLLVASGIPADPTRLDLERTPEIPRRVGPDTTVVHPGAAFPARRWPPDRFAAVARAESARGRPIAITAGPGEERLASEVAALAGLGPSAVLAGMDLMDLTGVVRSAGRVVSGDTGVAHLATAVATPSVVLFGPVSPARWGPPPERARHVALWAGREGHPRGRTVDPGLLAIDVADVLEALDHLPGPAPRSVEGPVPVGDSRRPGPSASDVPQTAGRV